MHKSSISAGVGQSRSALSGARDDTLFYTPNTRKPVDRAVDPLLVWRPDSSFTQEQHRLAAVLRSAYRGERSRHLARCTSMTTDVGVSRRRMENADPAKRQRTMEVWLTLAKCVAEWQVEPRHFLHRHFALLGPQDWVPLPLDFASDSALQQYRTACIATVNEKRQELTNSVQALAAGVSEHASISMVATQLTTLVANDGEFTPLFQYAWAWRSLKTSPATRTLAQRVMADCLLNAAMQYAPDSSEYDQAWGATWINANFARKAIVIHNAIAV